MISVTLTKENGQPIFQASVESYLGVQDAIDLAFKAHGIRDADGDVGLPEGVKLEIHEIKQN